MKFGEHIKQLRELNHLLQRQLANSLQMDTAMLSKIERGERKAKREHIPILAELLNIKEQELQITWIADQVCELIKEEENISEILKVVEKQIISHSQNKILNNTMVEF